jgi:hypothetical protein
VKSANFSTTSASVNLQTGHLDFSRAPPVTGWRLLAPKMITAHWAWQSWLVGLWVGPDYEWSLRPRGRIIRWIVSLHLLCFTVTVYTGTAPAYEPRER